MLEEYSVVLCVMAEISQTQSQMRSVTVSDKADLFGNHRNDFDDAMVVAAESDNIVLDCRDGELAKATSFQHV